MAEPEASVVEPGSDQQEPKPSEEQVKEAEAVKLSDIPEEQLLADERIQRMLQSMKDKEARRIERQFTDQLRVAEQRRAYEQETAQYQRYLADEDYDAIGRQYSQQVSARRNLEDAVNSVSGTIENMILERPEYQALGEEALVKIYRDVQANRGNVVTLMTELNKAVTDREVSRSGQAIRDEMLKEMQALRTELGLSKREEDKDNLPSKEVSGTSGLPAPRADEAELLTRFGEGGDVPVEAILEILEKQGVKLPYRRTKGKK